MKNIWKISKLDKLLKLSRIELRKSSKIKIGKKKLLMNGIKQLNLRIKEVMLHQSKLNSKRPEVYTHTVSNTFIQYLLIIYILFLGSGTLSRKSGVS